MPYAKPHTLLSVSEYARILGLDPLHFAGGFSELRPSPGCPDIWFQYDWQDADKVSRENIARLILEAERDIAEHLGYYPAPVWIDGENNLGEQHDYPRLHRRDLTGSGQDVRFRMRSLRLNWGYVIEGGQRATTLLDADAAFTTLDTDGDGFDETAQFIVADQEGLDTCEVHIYFKTYSLADNANTRTDPSSTGADPSWEIRPIRTRLIGTDLYIWCWVWDLFRPQLTEELDPDEDGIDADVAGNYVDEVEVYRIYNDPSTQAQFLWGNDISCGSDPTCGWSEQTGCIRVGSDKRNGIVVPIPGTYDATAGTFENAAWEETYEPDVVRVWYRAGLTSPHSNCEILDDYWARTIAMLATARFDWPLCTCNNTNPSLMFERWQYDKSLVDTSAIGKSFLASAADLGNPFGTRIGEVEAWKRISRGRGRVKGQAVIT